MKILVIISAFLSTAFIKSAEPTTLPITIKGHLIANPKDTCWDIKNLRIFVEGDDKILAETFSNNHGHFKLTFTPKNEKSFDFYCTEFNSDTILIASVKTFQSDNPEMSFYVPLKPQFNKVGQMICPKCKRADKVFEIIITHPPGYYDLVKKGLIDTTIHHLGISYCSRDKARF